MQFEVVSYPGAVLLPQLLFVWKTNPFLLEPAWNLWLFCECLAKKKSSSVSKSSGEAVHTQQCPWELLLLVLAMAKSHSEIQPVPIATPSGRGF